LSKSCKNGQKLCVIAQRFDWEFLLRIETLLFFAFSSLTSFPPFRSDHICGNLARWCLHFSVSIEDPNAVKDQKNEKLKKLNENFIEEVKKMYNLTKLQEHPDEALFIFGTYIVLLIHFLEKMCKLIMHNFLREQLGQKKDSYLKFSKNLPTPNQ
jgi:hypothetical protein